MTRKQLILKCLIDVRLKGSPFLLHDDIDTQRRVWISGGFRPLYVFRGASIGGDAADVRLRELRREHFLPIEMRRHKWEYLSPIRFYSNTQSYEKRSIGKTTPIYRLAMTPDEIREYDWEPAWEMPFTWKFQRENGRVVYSPIELKVGKEGQLAFA